MDNERREFGMSAKEMMEKIIEEERRILTDFDEIIQHALADND